MKTAQKGGPLSDAELFARVQEHTFRWFWERADASSGMVPDRTSSRGGIVATGGTGFAVMVLIVGAERGFISREAALERTTLIVATLERADLYHGAVPHWLDVRTGKTEPFSEKDDGGDLVETALLMQGLLTAREYFDRDEAAERDLRERINALWHAVDWPFYKTAGDDVLLWHWSPNFGFAIDHAIRGWNECLITYVLAAASPTHPIDPELYHRGWATGPVFVNGETAYGVTLPLGPPLGGPLFFAHYSFLGLDPRGLVDRYADYFQQNRGHVEINRAYCIANPKGFAGYGPDCWGLTASDNHQGYAGHSPTNDFGVITPTAALSSFPYAPEAAMVAMRHFHDDLGARIWTDWGFVDAFSEEHDWTSTEHLAIDQGPIVIMMENHRSGLLWRLFMRAPEVRAGLDRLGFFPPKVA
ncbi:glucoamylase family protein [Rhodobium gokarnense]|uniref:Glycoamylase-like domain-containing protein n=1 Tax=Rhodobium gokarnense TaxID=364296 RepID=A0ABT3HF69_9HYPH|nr:glucoamylase family protein [Rhodobium gokarnense]MCW2309047.1 hypothetical protein [Rhodobium gokarnense]